MEGAGPALDALRREAGGHRWQRVPPNERKGRVHTSTVTVAVMDQATYTPQALSREDVDMRFTRDTGPGGQHRNKTDSCVVLTHKKTGVTVKVDGRNQHQNRRVAFTALQERLAQEERHRHEQCRNQERAQQVGSGERGDKVRTYREQDDRVTDHRSGKSARLSDVLKGRLDLL